MFYSFQCIHFALFLLKFIPKYLILLNASVNETFFFCFNIFYSFKKSLLLKVLQMPPPIDPLHTCPPSPAYQTIFRSMGYSYVHIRSLVNFFPPPHTHTAFLYLFSDCLLILHRNIIEFCILSPCPAIFLNLFIVLMVFFVCLSLGFFSGLLRIL